VRNSLARILSVRELDRRPDTVLVFLETPNRDPRTAVLGGPAAAARIRQSIDGEALQAACTWNRPREFLEGLRRNPFFGAKKPGGQNEWRREWIRARLDGIQKLAVLSSLSIDPTLEGNNDDPGARITMQRRFTNNFLFTFATDVTSAQRKRTQGEYRFSKRRSTIATRDENGGFAIDGKFRKRH